MDFLHRGVLKSIHNALPKKVCDVLGVDKWKFIDEITGPDGSRPELLKKDARILWD